MKNDIIGCYGFLTDGKIRDIGPPKKKEFCLAAFRVGVIFLVVVRLAKVPLGRGDFYLSDAIPRLALSEANPQSCVCVCL